MSLRESILREGVRLNLDIGGSGAPVVFQHGLCGDRRQTAEVFPDDPAFSRLTLECRGHGLSDPGDPDRFSIATFAEDLAAAIEARHLGPAVVGGISMGAAIALRLAVRRPDLVRALILARPAWITAAAPDNMRPNAEVGDLLACLPPDEARAAFMCAETARRLAEEAPDNLASLTGFFSRQDPAVTSALLRKISADGPDVSESDLQAIKVPTLVLGQRHDAVHPFAHAEILARLIPTARLAEVTPKASDRLRYVTEFRQALSDFLRNLEQSTREKAD